MKESAVEFIYRTLHEQNYIYEEMSEYLEQAKEMEKQQIMDACDYGKKYNETFDYSAEQYYNETFKSE